MATFAHVENGLALDVVEASSPNAARALFGSTAQEWQFVEVPNGTMHGAWRQPDGTWLNPAPVESEPLELSKVAFMDLAYRHLGADLMAGVGRFGSVIMQARASTSPYVVASLERYEFATVFARDDVAFFLQVLVADPDIDLTAEEAADIIGAWPDANSV